MKGGRPDAVFHMCKVLLYVAAMLLCKFGTKHVNQKSTLCSPSCSQFELKVRHKDFKANWKFLLDMCIHVLYSHPYQSIVLAVSISHFW